jgi:hypothetical protein
VKAELPVVIQVAHQHDQLVAGQHGPIQGLRHQRAADAFAAPLRIDRQRPQQQRRQARAADAHRPIADRADDLAALVHVAGNFAELADRLHAMAVTVGRLRHAAGAEGDVQKGFDSAGIFRLFRRNRDHDLCLIPRGVR